MKYNNIFKGRFRLVSLHAYTQKRGWILLNEYGGEELAWEFDDIKTVNYPDGKCSYEGILKEYNDGCLYEVSRFSFFPQSRQLYIDRSLCFPDGFVDICLDDSYRVERITEEEYWLYELEGVESEPHDHRFRIRLKKFV